MAFSLSIHEPLSFVFTQCGHVVDDHTFRIHQRIFQAEITGMKTVRELVDTRTIKRADRATVKGLVELAGWDQAGKAGREEFQAIITDDPLIREIANLYAKAIAGRKKAIGFFHEVSTALRWLGYGKPDVARLQQFIRRHRA